MYSHKFEYVGDASQMRQGPTGTDRRPLATGDYLAGRTAGYKRGYENQTLANVAGGLVWYKNKEAKTIRVLREKTMTHGCRLTS